MPSTAHVMKVTTVAAGLASPHAAQASPAAIIRGHWMIQDRLHWVRDMDFDEDPSQAPTASATGHGCLEKPRYHNPAAGRLRQHRHPHFAATPAGRTSPYRRS